jgi:hypothetical protein
VRTREKNGLGNKHFSKTNSYLKANGEKEIDWIFNNGSLFLIAWVILTHRRTDFLFLKRKSALKRISIGVSFISFLG